jgi:hypothetical protein
MSWIRTCTHCGEDVQYDEFCGVCFNSPERREERRRYLQCNGLDYPLHRVFMTGAEGHPRTFARNADPDDFEPETEFNSDLADDGLSPGSQVSQAQPSSIPEEQEAIPRKPRMPSPEEAKAFLDAVERDTSTLMASFASPPSGAVKLMLCQKRESQPPFEIAHAYVFHVPAVGSALFLDRKRNERLQAAYRLVEVMHVMTVNMPVPEQTVIGFVEPIPLEE